MFSRIRQNMIFQKFWFYKNVTLSKYKVFKKCPLKEFTYFLKCTLNYLLLFYCTCAYLFSTNEGLCCVISTRNNCCESLVFVGDCYQSVHQPTAFLKSCIPSAFNLSLQFLFFTLVAIRNIFIKIPILFFVQTTKIAKYIYKIKNS